MDQDNDQKAGKETKPLKPKYRLFIDKYMEKRNVADAVRSVYKCKDPSKTGNLLMKRPEIIHEITRREEEYRASLNINKTDFLGLVRKELSNAKQESTRARLLQLYGDVLGYTKKEEATTTTNIFQSIEGAKTFLNSFKDTNADNPSRDSTEAVIVEPGESSRNTEHTTQGGGKETNTPLANDIYTSSSASNTIIDIN